jgi:hypothetical protein
MIINAVLDLWIPVFTEGLKTNISDELKLTLIKKAPFQEDPIKQAPYLLIGENEDKGVVPAKNVEIGGPMTWDVHLRIKAAPKVQKTSERAYYLSDLLGQRIVYLIQKNSLDLGDYGRFQVHSHDWLVIDSIVHRIYGGEGEWLSYVKVDFSIGVRSPGPYPFGEFPGDI